jgi:hypothetical protein
MDRVFTPENLIPLFEKIEKENLDLILVGGQAINIWANHYVNRVPKLLDYLPFSIVKKRERYQKIQDNLALRVDAKQSNQSRQAPDI